VLDKNCDTGCVSKKSTANVGHDDSIAGEKVEEDEHLSLLWAAVDMQGWRKTMEDAFIAEGDICPAGSQDNLTSCFGVFDGHGGSEVALFCQRHFVKELTKSEEWISGDIGKALVRTFHKLDEKIDDEANRKELALLKEEGNARAQPAPSSGGNLVKDDPKPDDTKEDENLTSSPAVIETEEVSPKTKSTNISSGDAIILFQRLLSMGKKNGENNKSGNSSSKLRWSPRRLTKKKLDSEDSKDGNPLTERVVETNIPPPPKSSPPPKPKSSPKMSPPKVSSKSEHNVMSKLSTFSPPSRKGIGSPPINALDLASQNCNQKQICTLEDHPIHAGCTSVVAVLSGKELIVANAGDSRAVLCRAGGHAEALSEDHKPTQDGEIKRIVAAGGFVNDFGRINGNLNLSRSIGDLKYKQNKKLPPSEQMITAEPDITKTFVADNDEFIIIGCDGIWDCLTNQDAVDFVRERIDTTAPTEILREMLDSIVSKNPRASAGIGGDNMTALVIDLLPSKRKYNSIDAKMSDEP